VIDITTGKPLIPLAQVPSLPFIPHRRCGRKLHVSTIFRWAQRGVNGVRLEVLRAGGSLCTTVEALQQFFASLAEAHRHECRPPTKPAPRYLTQVERELDAARI
jgi:hypothetical protein